MLVQKRGGCALGAFIVALAPGKVHVCDAGRIGGCCIFKWPAHHLDLDDAVLVSASAITTSACWCGFLLFGVGL